MPELALSAGTIDYEDTGGAGPPIVFSHGLVMTGSLWRGVVAELRSDEAFDNVPPGLPGRMVGLAAKLPGGLNAALQSMRLRPLRRSPLTFGWMSKRPIPNEVVDAWLEPALGSRAIRRDLRKYAGSSAQGSRDLLAATERLRGFRGPALVAWASEDRVMPPEHGRRLAELLPEGRLVEIEDSYTLIPEDRPAELAAHIRAFMERSG